MLTTRMASAVDATDRVARHVRTIWMRRWAADGTHASDDEEPCAGGGGVPRSSRSTTPRLAARVIAMLGEKAVHGPFRHRDLVVRRNVLIVERAELGLTEVPGI